MWEYKIFKTDLGWSICKKRERNWMTQLWFLYSNNIWGLDKKCAKTFFNREDAVSNLVISKVKWEKDATELPFQQEKKELEQESEKKSWAEL